MKKENLDDDKANQEREVYLTLNELCEWLKIPKTTIYDYTYQKKIPFVRVGKLLRFPQKMIELWLISPEETLRMFFENLNCVPMRIDARLHFKRKEVRKNGHL